MPGGDPPSAGFPRSARLLQRRDFDRAFREGRKVSRPSLSLFVAPPVSPDAGSRIGFVISGKVAKSVQRNRLRRILRDEFRRARPSFLQRCDVVVLLRHGKTPPDPGGVRADFYAALARAGVLPAAGTP